MTRLSSLLVVVCAAACASTEKMPPQAADDLTSPQEVAADLEPRSGSGVTGRATFTESDDGVIAEITIAGATPGQHGVHLHDVGDCSAPDAKSAGDHFDPAGAPHGSPNAPDHHTGDMGNIEAGDDGRGKVTVVMPDTTVRAIIGRALIVHADPDDLQTQPSGNSGDRVACGVVTSRPR